MRNTINQVSEESLFPTEGISYYFLLSMPMLLPIHQPHQGIKQPLHQTGLDKNMKQRVKDGVQKSRRFIKELKRVNRSCS